MFKVAHTLAVAEQSLEFEHRDLHWGNVLVKEVKGVKLCEFKLDGDIFKVHFYLTDPHMGDAFYIGMGVVAFFLASRPCHYQFFLSPSFSSIYIVLLLPRVRTTLS